LGKRIGFGSFGSSSLSSLNLDTHGIPSPAISTSASALISGKEAANKLESVKAKHLQLQEYESNVHKILNGSVGVPFVHWYGAECDYNAMF
jgi:hypothetical protein